MPSESLRVYLRSEFATLRKGYGVFDPDLPMRLGPNLSKVAKILESDSRDTRQAKLRATLTSFIESLPDDLKVAATAALNLNNSSERLTQRVALLAKDSARNQRTIIRRIDDAFNLIVNLILVQMHEETPSKSDDAGWYVDALDVLVRLDGQLPEITERRTIVATSDGLDHIDIRTSMARDPSNPSGPHELRTEVTQGGMIVEERRIGSSSFQFIVKLPRTLQIGDRHSYQAVHRIPAGQPMRPHYLLTPLRPYVHFNLIVRFSLENLPSEVQRITHLPPRVIDDPEVEGESIVPDRVGEVHATFADMAIGYGYGIRWQ